MNESILYVNFDYLSGLDPDLMLFFKGRVSEVIKAKFEGTGVQITQNVADARMYAENGYELKRIFIHDQFEHQIEDSWGETNPELQTAYVDVSEIPAESFESMAEITGLVASHESGHLFLGAHSLESGNLLSRGDETSAQMVSDMRMDLEFTELQKLAIRHGVPEGITFNRLEQSLLITEKEFTLDDDLWMHVIESLS